MIPASDPMVSDLISRVKRGPRRHFHDQPRCEVAGAVVSAHPLRRDLQPGRYRVLEGELHPRPVGPRDDAAGEIEAAGTQPRPAPPLFGDDRVEVVAGVIAAATTGP